jgi:hypothetical protein
MRTKLLLIAIGIIFSFPAIAQNVGVNTDGSAPDASAGLDINFTNKGLLIPRVALTATNAAGPITSPANWLMVFNTATAGASPNNVWPGPYYWNGSQWVRILANPNDAWTTRGNSGSTAPTNGFGTAINNNFIGTTDDIDFAFGTNNFERMRIKTDASAGTIRVGIGTTGPVNLYSGSSPTLLHIHDAGSTSNDFSQLVLSSATTTSGNRTGVLTFTATAATNERRAATIESYLTAASGANVTADLRFFTNNNNSFTEKLRIQANGNVGIGTTTPGYRLEIDGDARTTTQHYVGTSGAVFDGTNQGGSIELGGGNLTAGVGTPFIDFHFNGLTQDYNTRIINDANGRLNLIGNLRFTNHASGANGAILRTTTTGDLTTTNFSGNANDVLLGNGTFGPVPATGIAEYAVTATQFMDNTNIGDAGFIRLTRNGAVELTGIAGGYDGRILYLTWVPTANVAITIANESAFSSVANRILTNTNANLVSAGGVTASARASAILIYSGVDSRWHVISWNP